MISSFPDVIVCINNTGNGSWLLYNSGYFSGASDTIIYGLITTSNMFISVSATTGAVTSQTGWTPFDCAVGTTMSSLYSAGRAFNMAKGPAAQWLQSGFNAYYNAGNVGIGTTNPTVLLHVGPSEFSNDGIPGNTKIAASSEISNGYTGITAQNPNSSTIYMRAYGSGHSMQRGGVIGTNVPEENLYFTPGVQNPSFSDIKMSVLSDGKVGIGITNPSEKLHVEGGFLADYIDLKDRGGDTYKWRIIEQNGSAGVNNFGIEFRGAATQRIFNITPSGNVGIGTVTPSAKFQVSGGGTNRDIQFQPNSNTIFSDHPGIRTTATGWDVHFDSLQGFKFNLDTDGNQPNSIFSITNSSLDLVTVLKGGNVGIGISSPTKKLDIAGDIQVSVGSDICISGGNCLSTAVGAALSQFGSRTTKSIGTVYQAMEDGFVIVDGTTANGYYRILSDQSNPPTTEVLNGKAYAQYGSLAGSTVPVKKGDFWKVENTYSSNPRIIFWQPIKGVFIANDGHSLDSADGTSIDALYVNNSGNVGIGTSTPGQKLTVDGVIETTSGGIKFPDGSIQTTSAASGTNNSMYGGWPDAVKCTSSTYGEIILMIGQSPAIDGNTYYIATWSSGSNYLSFNSSGTLLGSSALGTVTNCTTNIATITAAGRAFNFVKGPAGQWLQSGTSAYYNAGNVGIGTANPSTTLEVVGSIVANNGNFTTFHYNDVTANGANFHGLRFRGSPGASTAVLNGDVLTGIYGGGAVSSSDISPWVGAIRVLAAENFTSTANGTRIDFATTPLGGVSRAIRMTISPSGSVGIGTANPVNKLEVVGGSTKLEQEPWIYPSSYGGSWVNYGDGYGNFGYRKDSMGYLRLRGLIKNGTAGAAFFTLPVGYRPAVGIEFSIAAANGANPGIANVIIQTNGAITVETMTSNSWISFDNVSIPLD